MKKKNLDEFYILEIGNKISEVCARFSTPEEDGGYHKADVVLLYRGKEHYVQVSHLPKSKKQNNLLLKRETFPISTHKFDGISRTEKEIKLSLENFLGK